LSLAKAVTEHRPQWPNITLQKFASVISASKTEIVKRSEVLELMKPVKITDIGGLELLKDWVIKRKSAFTDAARAFGVDIPKGIVLIGPPGTGKSMGAKAISYEFAFPLIRFDVGRVFGSLVGQSESRVRSALKQLEAMAPCIAFLDEVDKAGIDPRQAGGDGGTSKRVMGSILTFMQETTAPVFWILTANRPNSLPPELLRKGRLDEVFSVLPPNRAERKEIIKIHLAKRNQPMIKGAGLEQLLDRSQGYVGAEIEAAIKEAVVDAYNNGGKPVTGEAICEQLACMKPISIAFKEDFDAMAAWASNNARPSSIQTEESKIVRAVVRKGRHLN
jgi:SpoVK/Ycf46/Vps4 family AAA+-type ATPase